MAATILQIMQGLETRLATITSPRLRVSDTVPDQIDPAATGGYAIVGVPPLNYRESMGRGRYMLRPTITVLTSQAVSRIGQETLAAFANPTGNASVITAIEADKTLGGIVEDTVVDDFRPLGIEEVGVIGYYGGLFSLRVITTGT